MTSQMRRELDYLAHHLRNNIQGLTLDIRDIEQRLCVMNKALLDFAAKVEEMEEIAREVENEQSSSED